MLIEEILKKALPEKIVAAGSALLEIEFRSVQVADGHVVLTARVVRLEPDNSIRDIVEQEIEFAAVEDVDAARCQALAAALQRVLPRALAAVAARDMVMPADVLPKGLLGLKSCTSVEQFEKALLAQSRLGKLINA